MRKNTRLSSCVQLQYRVPERRSLGTRLDNAIMIDFFCIITKHLFVVLFAYVCRFQLTAKLCQEVLGGVVDGAIPLDDDTASVVRDTLGILTSKEIKLSSLRR